MRTTERLLFLVTGIGFTMDAFHLPFAGLVYTAGLAALALAYCTLGILFFPRPGLRDRLIPLSIGAGLAVGLAVFALLFRVQQWPYATFLGWAATGGCVITLATMYLLRNTRPEQAGYTKRLALRTTPAFIIAVVLSAA